MRTYLRSRVLGASIALLALAAVACGTGEGTDDGTEATGGSEGHGTIDSLTLGGPPECEERSTCYAGLVENYGLEALEFEAIAETAPRVAALTSDEIQLALLFSTQPVIAEEGLVVLEEPEGIVPAENIVPVVNAKIVDEYGDDLVGIIDGVSETITTEALLAMNGQVELDAEDPSAVAAQYLEENDLLGDEDSPVDGAAIKVGSFNFPESQILAEIYAQALESHGYEVEKQLDLGAREVIFPELRKGNIDLLPEYIGSALAVGFGVEGAPADPEEGATLLQDEFGEKVQVLAYAPAEDKNVFVVTHEFSDEHDVTSLEDLADLLE